MLLRLKSFSMLRLAHTLERLWFAVFDPSLSPHQTTHSARINELHASSNHDFLRLYSVKDKA